VKVQVGYNRRHQPLAIEYARLMKELGPQRHLKVQFWRAARQEPGFYDDTLVHCLDFISQQLGRLEVKRVQVWPADAQTPGLDQGWRIDLGSAHDPRISAEIDIRPAVGRDIECYTVLGLKRSIALQYPHIGTVDGQAALVAYDGGNERVIYRARMTNRETDSKCRHSGFLRQMAEFCQLCAGTLAAPGCGLEAAMEALRIRDEISALIRSDVTLAQIGGRPA
jgi:predicted dehydrogenase